MDREHLILREVVEGHIDSGEAIGSKAVSTRLRNVLSSASIRAVMATLVERGLLAQPHTSAGRVPTDRGYREYLDTVLAVTAPSRDRVRLDLHFKDGVSPSELMRAAAAAAACELGAAALVIAPRLEESVLQRMELVWLGPGRTLAIAVTDAGLVHERLLSVGREITARDLEGFANFLNSLLPGRTLGEVRRAIEAAQVDDRDQLETKALELGQRALEAEEATDLSEVLVEGTSRVLAQREFAEAPERASELLRALEERMVWLDLLDLVARTEDTRVYVGAEVPEPGLRECGLVVTRFSVGRATGVVVVFGPKRLDYRRAIPLVGLVGRRLGEVLRGDAVDHPHEVDGSAR